MFILPSVAQNKIKNCFILFLLFFCLSEAGISLANDLDYRYDKAFRVQRISLDEGLSQSSVQEIIQDQDGYVWLGTEDGLNRYDSYEFKVYRNDLRKKDSLHENSVISLLEEPGYGIWVGTVAGLSLFNPVTESFTNYTEDTPRLKTFIRKLFLANDQTVWVASDKGLFYIDKDSREAKAFESSDGRKFDFQILAFAQKNNDLYVSSRKCLFKIDLISKAVENLCNAPALKKLFKKNLTVLIIQDDTLWIGSKKGLFSLNLVNNEFKEFYHNKEKQGTISDNYIQDFALDKDSFLWIATTEGLNYYNKNKETFEHYIHQSSSVNSLSANDVISLYIDREELIWLGTYGAGVNILNPNQHQFEHLLTKTDVIEHGNNTAVHGIVKDRYEALWIATYGGGLIHYDLLTGEISRPLNDQNVNHNKFAWSLAIDHENRLWQASISDLILIDIKSKKVIDSQFIVDGEIQLHMGSVNKIFEDKSGVIWIASDAGFYRCDSITKVDGRLMISLTNLTSYLPRTYTQYGPSVLTLAQDHDGNLWLGGAAGLVYYNPERDTWVHYTHEKDNPKSLSNSNIQVIFIDSLGNLWVGTGNGLNRLVINSEDLSHVYFERITRYDGIPNDSIYGILEDKNHKIWLSTNLGIVKYSDNRNEIEAFRRGDGLSSDEFNLGAYYSDDRGRLYFGSINGITSIKSEPRLEKEDSKKIIFSKIKIGEREVDTYELNHSERPQVYQRKNETTIDISVANISFSKLNTQRYRYRIIGLDDKWNFLGTRRSIFIASLPQGNYIIEIQSRNSDEAWRGGTKKLFLKVETDFWRSRQGIYLIVFIITLFYASSLWLLSRYYRKRLSVVEKKMELSELRLKEIKIDNELMMHELGEREQRLSSLHQKLDIAAKKLDSQRFKDVTTGFYRVNYLYKVVKEKVLAQAESNEVDERKEYYSLAVFELLDYARIHQQHGSITVSEFSSKIADLMRQKIDAGSQVFTIQNGQFLILSKEKDSNLFKSKLMNLREHILISYFDVANGISESTRVAMSLLNLQGTKLNSTRNLPILIDLLLQSHLINNDPIAGKVIEILGTEQSVDLLFDLKSENINQYIQAGKIKYHIVS